MYSVREKGAVAQVRINTVTIERKKFSEVYGVFRALYSSSRLFSIVSFIYNIYMKIDEMIEFK